MRYVLLEKFSDTLQFHEQKCCSCWIDYWFRDTVTHTNTHADVINKLNSLLITLSRYTYSLLYLQTMIDFGKTKWKYLLLTISENFKSKPAERKNGFHLMMSSIILLDIDRTKVMVHFIFLFSFEFLLVE